MDNVLLFSYTALEMGNSFSSSVRKSCPSCVSIAYLGRNCSSLVFRTAHEETDMMFFWIYQFFPKFWASYTSSPWVATYYSLCYLPVCTLTITFLSYLNILCSTVEKEWRGPSRAWNSSPHPSHSSKSYMDFLGWCHSPAKSKGGWTYHLRKAEK